MPNIFPPIQLTNPALAATVQPDDNVPTPGVLGSVSAPSSSSIALNSADNDVQAAKDRYAGDVPKKYDYSAHSVLGNVGHVLARTANIAGDILDPAATSLIPGSDLYNAHKRAGDLEEVDKANEKQMAAQKEADSVDNEQANREQKDDIESSKENQATAKTNAQLAQHGFKMDPDKGIVPLNYEEMSPTQQAVVDLKGSQSRLADAKTEYEGAMQRGDTAAARIAQAKLQAETRSQDIALQRIGLSRDALGFQQDKFYNPQPTATERNKGDLAHSSIHQIGEMRDVIDRRPEIFGPGAGRANRIQQWLGSSDPDAIKYRSSSQYLADHSAALFGGRGEYIMKQMHDLTDERFGPEALKQALTEAEKTSQGFANAGTTHGKGGTSGYSTPPSGTLAPSDGRTQTFHVGDKVYNIPADKVADFKKDFPNAR